MNAAAIILTVLLSHPGESMDQFVERIAPELRSYTVRRDVEVCGAIGRTDDGYVIHVQTSKQRSSCRITEVEGEFTGWTVHTHPRAAVQDFSDDDRAAGQGYLVTTRDVLKNDQYPVTSTTRNSAAL